MSVLDESEFLSSCLSLYHTPLLIQRESISEFYYFGKTKQKLEIRASGGLSQKTVTEVTNSCRNCQS